MIKGIFFDVGGTLYSYGDLHAGMRGLIAAIAARLELEHDYAELAHHYRRAVSDIDAVIVDKPFYLIRDYFAWTFARFLARIDQPHLHGHGEWFVQQRVAMMGRIVLKPDCHATLGRLQAMGLYLSVLSNADEDMLQPLIERAELQRWLTHWTSSEAARSCKPDRRCFEIALEKSGLAPDQVLFVGDSVEQDVAGAHAAGMTTVLIADGDHPAPMHTGREVPEPDFHISILSALPGIVESLGVRQPGISSSTTSTPLRRG